MQDSESIQAVQVEERKQTPAMAEAAKPKAKPKPKTLKLTSRAKMGKAKAAPKAKARKARGSRDDSMAAFVDGLMMQGMTVDELFKRASAESKKRGILRFTVRRKFDRFIAARERQTGKWKVTRKGARIQMVAVEPKAAKAKPAPKNGKPSGRKVAKRTENGRQQVVAAVTEPVTATETV